MKSGSALEPSSSSSLQTGEEALLPEGHPVNLGKALERAGQLNPRHGAVYLDGAGGAQTQSYPELLEEAARVLAGLRALKLAPGQPIIFQLEHNRDFITAFWSCVLGGFVPVPVSISPTYEQPHSTLSKLRNAWSMLGRPVVVASRALAPRLRDFAARETLAGFQVTDIEQLRAQSPAAHWHSSEPDDLALLLLTSGSTGLPKAVRHTHRTLLSWAMSVARACDFTDQEVSLNWMPLDHVGGLVMFHLRDVVLGCRQIHAPTEPVLQRPLIWLDWIEQYRVTLTWAPNFAFGLINEQAGEVARGRWDLSSLRFILNGGEAIVSKTARRFLTLLSPHGLPPTAMRPAWGMSETSSSVTFSRRFTLASTSDEDPFVEVGEPIPGLEIRIVDHDDRPVASGKIGRLQIRGVSITPGYHQNPEANQKSYTADGWFITGDLGVLRDGQLSITGREKDVIIINGVNFYSHEIESAVEAIAGVEVSFTAACAIRPAGENTDRIAIFFCPSPAAEPRLPELIKTIRTTVARKEGVTPDFIVPLAKNDIPKTAIGKIQRSQLKERFERGEFAAALARSNPPAPPLPLLGIAWREAPLNGGAALPEGSRVLVFADPLGLGEKLGEKLRAARHACVIVRPGNSYSETPDGYQINVTAAGDYARLFSPLGTGKPRYTHVVHAWSYPHAAEPASVAAIEADQSLGSFSLLRLLHAWPAPEQDSARLRLLVVTSRVHQVSSLDAVDFTKSPLLGITRTIPHEYGWLECAHLDLPGNDIDEDLPAVQRELAAQGTTGEVAVRDGIRSKPVLRRIEAAPLSTPVFQQRGFYVITGGFGGIAQIVARQLAKDHHCQLLLLGRSPLPDRRDWAATLERDDSIAERVRAWQALEQGGAEVRYAAGELDDPDFLRSAIKSAEAHWQQPLAGILHLAGTHRECTLADETERTFWDTIKPKLAGAWVMHQVACEFPGCLFVNFSSVLGHFGAAGHAAYAAANASLDRFAYRQRADGIRSSSLSWSLWENVGMGRGFNALDSMGARGYLQLSPGKGYDALCRALESQQVRVLIGLDADHRVIRRHLDPDAVSSSDPATEYVAPRNHLERSVARIWEEVLGIERIGVKDNFFELGGRSLLAARIFGRIEKELGRALPLAALFKAPTVEALVGLLGETGELSYSALAIQPRGSQPPFFCIPGAGSDAIVFQDLSRELGSDQPFYGLQAPGLDATPIEGEFPTMEKVAADFIQAIRNVQPVGPYFVGGHCFGSLLAWEVARQMKEQGHEVGLLALLDPIVSNVFSAEILGPDRLRYHSGKFMRMSLDGKCRYFLAKVRNFGRTLVMRQRVGKSLEQARSMHSRYRLGRYPGDALVFLANDSFFKIAPERDPRRYYERLAQGGTHYLEVPGDHHSMLHETGATDLAAGLRAALAKARAPQTPAAAELSS